MSAPDRVTLYVCPLCGGLRRFRDCDGHGPYFPAYGGPPGRRPEDFTPVEYVERRTVSPWTPEPRD